MKLGPHYGYADTMLKARLKYLAALEGSSFTLIIPETEPITIWRKSSYIYSEITCLL
jgi:hypothetical protein